MDKQPQEGHYYFDLFLNIVKYSGALITIMKILEICFYVVGIKEEIKIMNEKLTEKVEGERHDIMKEKLTEKVEILGERYNVMKERIDVGFEQTNAKLELLNEKWSFLNDKVNNNFGISKEKNE